MNQQREQMEKALKEQLVPELRERGFQGTFPHFRRIRSDRIDYLTVQFHRAGGSFVVEIAKSGPDGVTKGFGSEVSVKKLNVQYFKDRLRLGSDPSGRKTDHWFEFGHRSYNLLKLPGDTSTMSTLHARWFLFWIHRRSTGGAMTNGRTLFGDSYGIIGQRRLSFG